MSNVGKNKHQTITIVLAFLIVEALDHGFPQATISTARLVELIFKTLIDCKIIIDVMNDGCLFPDLIIENWAYSLMFYIA
jgi:hypothetical protein